jgi:uncharacterized damage-inducible protein DinB
VPGELGRFRAAFEISSAHTSAVIAATPEALWDVEVPGLKSLRSQLLHLALVRESICRQLAGAPTAGGGKVFEDPPWQGGTADLGAAFQAHVARCREHFGRMEGPLDLPFTTPFGNQSTPWNYLLILLLEEQHHRAQMTQILRLNGVEPPPYPGQAWVELGVMDPSAE